MHQNSLEVSPRMIYRIRYADGSWYGKGWRPYASKAAAVKLPSRQAAEDRLANLRRIAAANPSWRQDLFTGATIEETAN